MTKEELVNEAEKSLDKRLGTYAYIRKQDCYTNYVDGYIDSAELREKRIAELTEQNTSLLTSVENLNKSVQELEAQIEKMRNCRNCKKNCEGYRNCTLQNLCYWEWDNGDIH